MALTKINRADFLLETASLIAAVSGLGWLKSNFLQFAFAEDCASNEPILVHIFLRGGCDGLSFVAPISGPDRDVYENSRPNIHLKVSGKNALLPLNRDFGFHPEARALQALFHNKRLGVVHGFGSPANSRSHFQAQSLIDYGIVDAQYPGAGWITRYIKRSNESCALLPAIASGTLLQKSLLGCENAVSVNNLNHLDLGGKRELNEKQTAALIDIFKMGNSSLHRRGSLALSTLRILQKSISKMTSIKKRNYSESSFADRLSTLSDVLKMDLGVKVASLDFGGWDTHTLQGIEKPNEPGKFGSLVAQLSEAVGTFLDDIEYTRPDLAKRINILIYSEFGRRVRENGNRGTDHGHGGICFAIGPGVDGGKMHGTWPGLQKENLSLGLDLAVTTDYREVLSEFLRVRMKVKDAEDIFPGFKAKKDLRLFIS